MSCVKEFDGPCEYKDGLNIKENSISCRWLKTTVNYTKCNSSCPYYREEYDDYDWRDHWC